MNDDKNRSRRRSRSDEQVRRRRVTASRENINQNKKSSVMQAKGRIRQFTPDRSIPKKSRPAQVKPQRETLMRDNSRASMQRRETYRMSDGNRVVRKRSELQKSNTNDRKARPQPHRQQPPLNGNQIRRRPSPNYQQKRSFDRNENRKANRNSSVRYERPKKTSVNIQKNNHNKRNIRKRKIERNASSFMVVAGVIIFIIVFAYLAVYTARTLSITALKNETVKLGTIDVPYSAEALIVRDEKVFNTSNGGFVEYNYSDNDKVKSGQTVCYVKDMENMEIMENDLDRIDEELLDMQSYRDELSLHYEDFKKYNSDIASVVDSFASEYAKGNVSEVFKMENMVSDLWRKRNSSVLSDDSGSAQELFGAHKDKEAQISGQTISIKNDKGGILSYYADGFENKYNFENSLGDIVIPQSDIDGHEETQNLIRSMADDGAPVFKMVYSNEWYIVSYIKTDYVADWAADDYVTVYLTGKSKTSKSEKALVKSIVKGDKESYVVLKMEKNMIDYITDRFISLKVSKADEGYKILNSAITDQNLVEIPKEYVMGIDKESEKNMGVPHVITVSDKGSSDVEVKISAEDKEKDVYCVQIEYGKINIGTVIQNPKDPRSTYRIDNITTVKGIFITNSGITKFRKIDFDGAVSNDTHTVLNIQKNPYIELYDKYAADASTVYNDEKTVKPSI